MRRCIGTACALASGLIVGHVMPARAGVRRLFFPEVFVSYPQPVRPGATWHITRRCIDRRFYLLPWENIVTTLKFCLAYSASKYPGVRIHAMCFPSNHFHLIFTDTHGDMPAFMREFNSMTGRAVGKLLNRRGGIWSKEPYGRVELKDGPAITDAIVYTLANAVAAGLVPKHSSWPGLHSTPQDMAGREFTAKATGPFFAKRIEEGDDVRQYSIVAPSMQKVGMDSEAYVQHVAQRLREVESEAVENMAKLGRKFLGAKNAGRVKLGTEPKSSDDPIEKINPRIASKDKSRRLAAIEELQTFRARYREAWLAYCAGDHEVVFPPGTYAMRTYYRVSCAPFPDTT